MIYDWPGENHTGEITELFDQITDLFLLYDGFSLKKQKIKLRNLKMKYLKSKLNLCFPRSLIEPYSKSSRKRQLNS